MVHAFRALNGFFLTDTESGSVFETDELTHCLVLSKIRGLKVFEDRNYSPEEIAEAESELRRLTAQGLLFSGERLFSAGAAVPDGFSADGEAGSNGSVIKALCLNVCHACNLRCAYCFAQGGSYGGSHAMMSAETACAAVDFLIERSGKRRNLEIDFFGGEPLLNFETVRAAVAHARSRGEAAGKRFRFTITTNGVLLGKDEIGFLNSEFSNVVISIDGRESVHNSMRKSADGRDCYKEIAGNALALIKDRKGDYFIRGTFTNRNLDFAEDVFALSALGFKNISMEPAALPEAHPLAIREEHLERVFAEYETLAARLYAAGADAPDFFHFRADLNGAPCRDKLLKGCGAGSEYAAVSPDGKIYPCHQFVGTEEYLIGDLNRAGIGVKAAKRIPQYPVLSRKACRDCWAKYYCGGGCAANSVSFNGDVNEPYGTACKLFRKRAELSIALYAKKLD